MELLVLQVVQVDKKQSYFSLSRRFPWFQQHLESILHEIVGFTTILLKKYRDNTSKWNPPRRWKSEVGGLGGAETMENVD